MVTTYSVLKTIHVLAAITWVGGSLFAVLLELKARGGGPVERGAYVKQVAFVAPRTFIPASLVLIVTGFWMIGNGNLPYDTWVVLAIIGWAVTFVTGNALLGPTSKKAAGMIEAGRSSEPETARYIDRFVWAVRLDQLILVLVVIDMVIKPGQ